MPRSPTIDFSSLLETLLLKAASFPGIPAYIPHASQLKFHESESKEKLYIGGNRSGKTVGGVAEDVMWLTGQHKYRKDIPQPPIRGRIVTVDIEEGIKKIIIPELSKWVPPSFLKNGSWEDSYDKAARTLTLSNDSFVELMSYEQDVGKFAGTSRHFCHFDEEPPLDIFNECLMRLVDTDGSYWITMTPLIEMTWIKDRIYDPWSAGDASIFVLEVDTEENPHINMTVMERLSRNIDDSEKLARRKGTFVNYTGLIYAGSFSSESYLNGGNVVPDIVGELDKYIPGWGHFVCMDHGLRNPTAFLFCAYDHQENIIVYDELFINTGKNIISGNALLYLQKLEELGVQPLYCIGDPSIQNRNPVTGTSLQSEYSENGCPVGLGNNDKLAGIARVQNRFRAKKLFISERCENTLRELGGYRWDRFGSSKLEARRNKKEKPLDKDNHCVDALRYGVMSRPALDNEDDTPVGNVLGIVEAGPIDMDYELCFKNKEPVDEILGIEW